MSEDIPALLGGPPVRDAPWPQWPVSDESEIEQVREVLAGTNWNYLHGGKKHIELEKKFAGFIGVQHAVTVATGTMALEIALRACGVRPGDEVPFQAYTCYADAEAVLHLGALPIPVDIDANTYCMDVDDLERSITPHTRAIVVIHWAGRPADMDRITELAERHALPIIEDCCLAHGAEWKGRKVGSIGRAGCFSFGCGKLMAAGECGVITTDDSELAAHCEILRDRGRLHLPDGREDFAEIGWSYRASEVLPAIALAQLERYPEQLDRRNGNSAYLSELLSGIDGLCTMERDPRITRQAVSYFIMRYDADGFGGLPRERFIAALSAEGIPCYGGYAVPFYEYSIFTNGALEPYPLQAHAEPHTIDYQKMNCPNAQAAHYTEAVWLEHPLFLGTREDMEDIARAINKIKMHAGALAEDRQ